MKNTSRSSPEAKPVAEIDRLNKLNATPIRPGDATRYSVRPHRRSSRIPDPAGQAVSPGTRRRSSWTVADSRHGVRRPPAALPVSDASSLLPPCRLRCVTRWSGDSACKRPAGAGIRKRRAYSRREYGRKSVHHSRRTRTDPVRQQSPHQRVLTSLQVGR